MPPEQLGAAVPILSSSLRVFAALYFSALFFSSQFFPVVAKPLQSAGFPEAQLGFVCQYPTIDADRPPESLLNQTQAATLHQWQRITQP